MDKTTRSPVAHSPARVILSVMAMIFVAEAFVMLMFTLAGIDITLLEGLLDALALSLLIAPGMYWMLFRPMVAQQQEIARSRQWLKDITDHLPEALISIDRNGIICSFNPAAEAMFGYAAGEIIGQSVNLLMSEEDAREHDAHIRRYLETGESHVLGRIREVEARRRTGEMFPAEIQVRELRSNDETYFIGMLRDISERRREEIRQQRIKERIERAQRLESLGVLAGGIAHDFNNILSSMLGNTELLRLDLGELDSEADECLRNIETGCNHAADLCRQMLAYAGKGRYVVQSVNLTRLVQEMEKLIRVSVPRSVNVVCDLSEDIPEIQADVAQMEQVVLNLLTNAAEAIGEAKGEIRLTTGVQQLEEADLREFEHDAGMKPGRFVFLEVEDNGCGIRPEDMAHLFEPFFTTKFTGRGLGMSAILGILNAHGGGIRIDSQVGEGTRIRVVLPVADVGEAEARPEQNRGAPADWQGRGRVLIVDDEQSIRCMACKMLSRMGFDAQVADGGEQALAYLKDQGRSVSLVLLDLTMPGMSGLEVLKAIRRDWPGIRVILSTGYGEKVLEDRFADCRPDGFVPKPFRYQQLLDTIYGLMS